MAAVKKETDELTIEVDPALFEDARVAYVLGRLTRGNLQPSETAALYAQFVEIALGGPEATMDAMNAYAAANGGRCPTEEFSEWLFEQVSEAGAAGKN